MASTTFVNGVTVVVADWLNDVNNFVYNGALPPSFIVDIANGGTNADNIVDARTNLGLGSLATQNSNNVTITGGSITGVTGVQASSAQLTSIAAMTDGIAVHTASNTFTPRSITATANMGISISNGNGVSGNPAVALDISTMTHALPDTLDYVPIYDVSGTVNRYSTVGEISSAGSAGVSSLAGTANQITASASTGAVTLSIPYQLNIGSSASGPSELRLFEDTANGANKVTIIAPANIASDATLTLQATTGTVYSSGGTDIPVLDGGTGASDAGTARTNLGVAIGSDVQAFSSQLTSIAGVGDGIVAHTAANTFTPRTITGTANLITVSNGDGVSGNPTLNVGSNVYTVGGTDVAVTDGGTGVSTMTTAYAPVCAGTTATGPLQVASTGLSTSGFVLTSNGASAVPSFQAVVASSFNLGKTYALAYGIITL